MKIALMVNEATMKSKDECQKHIPIMKCNNVEGYKNRICTLDVHEIADVILAGHSIVPAILDDKMSLSNEHFKHQQLFGLDFDNNDPFDKYLRSRDENYMTYERIMDICNQYDIAPAIIHESFSSTDEWKRYRVLFVTYEPISDLKYRRQFLDSLMKLFSINGAMTADTKCRDEGRLFYPGHSIVSVDQDARINPDAVIEKARNITLDSERSNSQSKASRTVEKKACNEMVEAIMNKDQKLYAELLSDAVEKAAKADGCWNKDISNKTGTIILKYFFKDYCPCIDELVLTPLESMGCSDVFELASYLPMNLMLGLPLHKPFSCILPKHDDEHPSASINQLNIGAFSYNCWGCIDEGKYLDIVEIFSLLMGSSFGEAVKFILASIGLEVQTEWQKQQRDMIQSNIAFVSSDYFKRRYSKLYNALVSSNAYGQLIFFLTYVLEHVTPSSLTRNERCTFFLSIRKASELMSEYGYTGSSKTAVGRKHNYLCFLGLFEKVPEHEIPVDILSRAIMTSKQKSAEYKTEYEYRQDFLYVPQYTAQLFLDVQAVITQNESLGVRRAGLSREQIIRTYGKEIADSIYTQDINKESSKRAEKFYNKYSDITKILIEKQGFACEAEILRQMNGYSKEEKKKLSSQCLPQLLIEYQYRRIRVNKDTRAEYAIPSKYKSGSIVIIAD